MKIIELEGRKIYRADKGRKVKFVNSNSKFSEIVVNSGSTREVVEVKK